MSTIIVNNQGSAPSTPSSGNTVLYVATGTKRLASKDDAGVVTNYDPGAARQFEYWGDTMDAPNNSDWAVGEPAPLVADSNNAAISVRLLDDTTEESFGFPKLIPAGATNVELFFKTRRETSGSAQDARLKLYVRQIADNSAPGAWSSGTLLNVLNLPADEDWQYDSQSLTLDSLSLTAGNWAMFEISRGGLSGDTLTGDLAIAICSVEFT